MSKRKRQRHPFKTNTSSKSPRITHLDSTEKIEQFYQSLSPTEQEAMLQDVAQMIQEREGLPEYPPGTRFVDESLINALTDGFFRSLQKQGKKPEPGDHLTATSTDGYTVEAWVVPTQMPDKTTRGVPFAMKIAVFDPEGHYLAASTETSGSSGDQPLHDYYIHQDHLKALAYIHQGAQERKAPYTPRDGDYLFFFPHWYRGGCRWLFAVCWQECLGADRRSAVCGE